MGEVAIVQSGFALFFVAAAIAGMLAWHYRTKWQTELARRCATDRDNARLAGGNLKLLQECTRLTCELAQTKQTLSAVQAPPVPEPIKARSSAEARRIVEHRNTEELDGEGDRNSSDKPAGK